MRKIEVAFSDSKLDSVGIFAKTDIKDDLLISGIENVSFSELYYLDFELDEKTIEQIASNVFTDPLVQKYSTGNNLIPDFDFYIEVELHRDVTDNLGIIAHEGIEDYLGEKINGEIRSAKRFYFKAKISPQDIERIAKEYLANEIIETYKVVKSG
ncbi:MAG TPA: hypothetical protein VJG83_01910 [archaeon]|nr:hypothetical protein [archaeon]